MFQVYQYFERYQGLSGRLTALPTWAKAVVFIAAIPGILLLGLSIVLFGVSVLALLLPTVPVYRLLRAVTGPRRAAPAGETVVGSSGRKPIEVTIIE